MLGIFETSIALLFAIFIAPDNVLKLFKYIVPLYTVSAIAILVLYIRNSKHVEKTDRVYNIPKNPKETVELTWKQKFAGHWDKHSREGWIEFVIFMGQVNATMANMLRRTIEATPIQNVITFKDETEKELKVDVHGKPENLGPYCILGTDENSSPPSIFEQAAPGKPMESGDERMWWDEETKSLMRSRKFPDGRWMNQQRYITEDDKMVLISSQNRLQDDVTCTFKVVFKRI